MNCLKAMAKIRNEFPEAKIIILTTYESDVEGAMKPALALTLPNPRLDKELLGT